MIVDKFTLSSVTSLGSSSLLRKSVFTQLLRRTRCRQCSIFAMLCVSSAELYDTCFSNGAIIWRGPRNDSRDSFSYLKPFLLDLSLRIEWAVVALFKSGIESSVRWSSPLTAKLMISLEASSETYTLLVLKWTLKLQPIFPIILIKYHQPIAPLLILVSNHARLNCLKTISSLH